MFLQIPFLPTRTVTCVIIDCNAPKKLIDNLQKRNITTILSAKLSRIMSSIATHPDMQIHPLGENLIACEPSLYEYYVEQLTPLGFVIIKGKKWVKSHYPSDIAYNVSRLGAHAFHLTDHTEPVILKHLKENNVSITHVNQGYTKCTMCLINEHSVITEDEGLAKELEKKGVDVLVIEQGDVSLNGFQNGFLGGASGLISPHELLVCGDITTHRNFTKIQHFAQKHSVEILSQPNEPLVDIGSIVPIMQYSR